MNKLLILLVLLIMITPKANAQARTPTEFRSYSGQYTYDRKTDGVIGRYYNTYKDKCDHNTECVICILPNAQAETGKSYTILTSGLIIIRTWDDYHLRGGVIRCHRDYDNMYTFTSMSEARVFANKIRERNKYIKRRN